MLAQKVLRRQSIGSHIHENGNSDKSRACAATVIINLDFSIRPDLHQLYKLGSELSA